MYKNRNFLDIHPFYRDPFEEQGQQAKWNQKPDNVPIALSQFLPEGVYFINHRLTRSENLTLVKLKGFFDSPMVRASYEYQREIRHSNVLFSSRALLSNIHSQKGDRWLVSPSAQAVILFLHGTGTQTAGAHIAKHLDNHFKNYQGVEVLSLDHPFHGEGPRTFLSSLKEEVLALRAFANKYIPSRVPLFVMAHSGGTVFAQQLMSMTDGPKGSAFFHPGLKGVILFSPIVDPAPNKSPVEKQKAFSEGQKVGLKEFKQDQQNDSLLSPQSFESQNPLGELYGMWNITQWSARIPDHKGAKYVPALMALGTHDPLIWTGFPKNLFYGYYDKLSNMETHYLEELPLLKVKKWEKVGHWLGEYRDPDSKEPIQLVLARRVIEKQLGEPLSIGKRPPSRPFVQAMTLFAHDLAFRSFLYQYFNQVSSIAYRSPDLGKKLNQEKLQMEEKISLTMTKIKKNKNQKIGCIWTMDNKEQALNFIRQMKLPENILNEISQAVRESSFFDLKNIINLKYLPSKPALLERGLVDLDKGSIKVDAYLKRLAEKQSSRALLQKEIKALSNKKSILVQQQKSAQKEVEEAISLIELAIKQADKEWPISIQESFEALKRVRDQAQQARVELIEIFEEIAPRLFLSGSSPKALKRLLFPHQQAISEDQRALSAYQQERQNVQRQVIQAIWQGEVEGIHQSTVYQKVARDLYGLQFYGEKSPQGDLYVKLRSINQELAETESALHKKTFLFEQGILEYQDIFLKLQALLKPHKGEGPDLIALATKVYKVYDVQGVLKGTNKDGVWDYDYVFQRVLDLYQKGLHSDLLPPLPGISELY